MGPVDTLLLDVEVFARPSSGGDGDDVAGALVALVGEDGDAESDAGGDDQMPAGGGQVVRVAGQAMITPASARSSHL